MVSININTIEKDMTSTGFSGASLSNTNSSVHQTVVNTNSQTNQQTTNEKSLPSYDINDPQTLLKTLIRFVMRSFYELPKSLVIEYIFHYEKIKQQDLAACLCIDPKQIRSYIQEFKRDKFILEDHRLESNESTNGRRNQDQYYYTINTTAFINVVKYRLINMQKMITDLERQQTYKQLNYKCERCLKEYTELDIGKLYDLSQEVFVCTLCEGIVHEDVENKETITNHETANMILFNEQMKPLFDILERIDAILAHEQQIKNASEQDRLQQNGNSTTNNNNNTNSHRSNASNVFDRATTINHAIEIVIEKDDDDYYTPMDIDETSNTDPILSTARGPGKPGKKSIKTAQSTTEVAIKPLPANIKSTTKKSSAEPKPLPQWFVRSTIHPEHDNEHSSNHTSQHTTTYSSTITRQLSNQKLTKSTSIHDIKQMLLVHESRRNKPTTLTPMEDSLSPPTPI